MRARLKAAMVAALLGGMASEGRAEEMTLTTYYPSPRGVYEELRVTEQAIVGGNAPPEARLHIVQPNAAVALRVDDQEADPTPVVIDQEGRVGLGTLSPTETLEVNGGVRLHPTTADGGKPVCQEDRRGTLWFARDIEAGPGAIDRLEFCARVYDQYRWVMVTGTLAP